MFFNMQDRLAKLRNSFISMSMMNGFLWAVGGAQLMEAKLSGIPVPVLVNLMMPLCQKYLSTGNAFGVDPDTVALLIPTLAAYAVSPNIGTVPLLNMSAQLLAAGLAELGRHLSLFEDLRIPRVV